MLFFILMRVLYDPTTHLPPPKEKTNDPGNES